MHRERIYISGGITGVPDYLNHFQKAQEELEEMGYAVINPAAILANFPKSTPYEIYMKVSLVLLDLADGIYMLPDWEKSRGANREYGYAVGKGIKVIRMQSDLIMRVLDGLPRKIQKRLKTS